MQSSTIVHPACRLLYVLGQLRPGGQERQLSYLLQAMNRARYQPAIAVWNCRTKEALYVREIEELGVPIYACSEGLSVRAKLAQLHRFVRVLQPEVIHSYCFYTNFAAWWASRGSRAIPIGSIRQDFIGERRLGGLVGTMVGRLSSRFPAVSISNNWTAKRAAEQCKGFFKPKRIYVVANAVETDRIRPSDADVDGTSLLAVGRLDPEKRWDRLLRAVAVLRSRQLEFSVRIAGDGLLVNELRSLAVHLGLNGRVEFLGRSQNIPGLLRESLFLVHTADGEGSPNVILEAMAAGRAVVATDAGDVAYLVDDGKTGFVVPRDDDARLVECMATLISNPALAGQMGQAGRAKVEREFKVERLVEETLAVYRAAGWAI